MFFLYIHNGFLMFCEERSVSEKEPHFPEELKMQVNICHFACING